MPPKVSKASKMQTTAVVQTGNSLAVIIPAPFARQLGIRPRDRVQVNLDQNHARITYTFLNIRQLPLV